MALIVKKFGGTSVKDNDKLDLVSNIIKDDYKSGNGVVVVVSAQGNTTDTLINKVNSITKKPNKRELDVLLSTGELITISLLCMMLEKKGVNCISLTGSQAGFLTDENHTNARIVNIKKTRILNELQKNKVVIVAGFQGVNKYDDITTFGRGGSDTSAVAIASALNAQKCQIYTDVDGIYSCDPKLIKKPTHIPKINYDEMLEMASSGAKVLHNRSVEMAKKYSVVLEVLSTIKSDKKTTVKEISEMEKLLVSGISKDENIVLITLKDIPYNYNSLFKVTSLISSKSINMDIIAQTISINSNINISFTVKKEDLQMLKTILSENTSNLNFKDIVIDEDVAKVSVIGAGMQSNCGVAAKLFGALSENKIFIKLVSTSEIKITAIVKKGDSNNAISIIHNIFF